MYRTKETIEVNENETLDVKEVIYVYERRMEIKGNFIHLSEEKGKSHVFLGCETRSRMSLIAKSDKS